MMYDLCSYDIHENDLEMAKELANELGLTIHISKPSKLLNHGIYGKGVETEYWYKIWFDEIEVESFAEGDRFEDDVFWNTLQERSTDLYMLKLLNS